MPGQGDPKKACKLLGITGADEKVVINAFKSPKAMKVLGTNKKEILAELSKMTQKKLKAAAIEKSLVACGLKV